MLKKLGIEDVPSSSHVLDEALRQAWRELDKTAKGSYEAFATIEKHQCILSQWRKGVRSAAKAPKLAKAIKEAIAALSRAPSLTRANSTLDGCVAAMEELDRRLGPQARRALGESLGGVASSPKVRGVMRQALGGRLGDRLASVLQRWNDARTQVPAADSSQKSKGPVRLAPVKEKKASIEDAARARVAEALARTLAKETSGSKLPKAAALALSRAIEQELFALMGSEDPRDYKCRARSLVFNLGAADGALRSRVLEGEVAPAELVRLDSDDLAPNAVREERRRQREAYFRNQVHVTERVPKRKRDLHSRGTTQRPDTAKSAPAAEKAETDAMVPLQPPTAAPVAEPQVEPGPEAAGAASVDVDEPGQDEIVELFFSSGEEESDEDNPGGCALSGAVGEAIDLADETTNDAAIARMLQDAPTTPSSSSSSSSSASDEESVEQLPPALRDGVSACNAERLPVETPASFSSGPSSSSSSAAVPAAAASADSVSSDQKQMLHAMGFDTLAVEAALLTVGGDVQRAVTALCEGTV